MNTTLIDLILIQLIVVIIVDISGFVSSFKSLIKYIVTKGKMWGSDYQLKPFDCSFCMTFWSGLIYLIFTDNLTISYTSVILVLSYFTRITKDVLVLIVDLIEYTINKVNEKI